MRFFARKSIVSNPIEMHHSYEAYRMIKWLKINERERRAPTQIRKSAMEKWKSGKINWISNQSTRHDRAQLKIKNRKKVWTRKIYYSGKWHTSFILILSACWDLLTRSGCWDVDGSSTSDSWWSVLKVCRRRKRCRKRSSHSTISIRIEALAWQEDPHRTQIVAILKPLRLGIEVGTTIIKTRLIRSIVEISESAK